MEMTFVVMILVLILGLTIPYMAGFGNEQRFDQTAQNLEKLSRSARLNALQDQRPWVITFSTNEFTLEPLFPDNPEPDSESAASFETGIENEEPESPPSFAIPDGFTMSLMPWPEQEWSNPDGFIWTFQPSGLCNPLQVRFEQGDNWMELTFNPITAEISDEAYAIR